MARIMCVGHAVQDYVFTLPSLPAGGRKFRASSFESVGGGPAATAAVAIARLGGAAMLAARVGADAVGGEIIAELENYGVDCGPVRRCEGKHSSLSAVMIDAAGERMIVNYRDDALPDDASFVPDANVFDAVLADTRWLEGARAAFKSARAAGVPAVLDADDPTPDDPVLLEQATHLAFSADGLRRLARTDDLREGLARIRGRTGAWCCATDGAKGAIVADETGLFAVGAYRVEAVDTLGAGDVWHGAFALALAEGRDEKSAVRFAAAAAALKVSRKGGRKGAPSRAEVEAFMQSHAPMEPQL